MGHLPKKQSSKCRVCAIWGAKALEERARDSFVLQSQGVGAFILRSVKLAYLARGETFKERNFKKTITM